MTAAPDLRTGPPRRSTDALDGIIWLPRVIDNLRASRAGTLGDYILSQSPMDGYLLHRLGLTHRELEEIVAAAPDDAAVIATLKSGRPEGVERAQRWSSSAPAWYRVYYWFCDVDDGYVSRHPLSGTVHTLANFIAGTVKRFAPSRYEDARRS